MSMVVWSACTMDPSDRPNRSIGRLVPRNAQSSPLPCGDVDWPIDVTIQNRPSLYDQAREATYLRDLAEKEAEARELRATLKALEAFHRCVDDEMVGWLVEVGWGWVD